MQGRIDSRATDKVHHVPRAEGRLKARLATRLRREGEADAAFTLRNVSPSGFMGECRETVRAGSKVVLLLPMGGVLEADVRWAINGRVGCKLRGRLTLRQRALVLALTAKNALLTWTALKHAAVAAIVIVLLLR